MKVKKAIIPAAGFGTRNLPITKVVPKEMFPIQGKPAIHYVVEEAIQSGIEEILIIISRSKTSIIDYFDRSIELENFLKERNKSHLIHKIMPPSVHIQYLRQPVANGLGDALLLAEPFINDEPFVVLLPDDIFIDKECDLIQLIETFKQVHSSVVGVKYVEDDLLKNYGVIKENKVKDNLYEILDIVEKPQNHPPSNLAVVGRYVFNPDIFSYLKKVKPDKSGEVQLTAGLKGIIVDKKCFAKEVVGERYDIGTEVGYVKLIERMNINDGK
ncbi:UTP--glucose-1-phosphate uridylyltransferase [Alkalihalobacillus pseudalcaliphilus]|uniref:UTP--glucose-1-phosphate uridylyltransferase n=1 Tax=Alkalihalobacillus pseudalcaliphilus TaxID=79884 RepID=UPI00064DBD5F|nr:UTP--glucose-1-phosphate uridylyltransferase [Alkalihalobacillus pseudalcaliphilus]KMK77325.1 UTP--glucose-1-phosphate uridylyltransferase [Alkalihalobacillus pseudalcaliphilus]